MKDKLLGLQPISSDVAALLLRLIFGGLFIYHGYPKLVGFDQILPMFPDLIGIGSKTSLILVVFAEFFCGIFIVIGLLTRLSVIPIFITMFVAFFIAHAQDPFQAKNLPFVYLLLSFVVFVLGSGKFSVDKYIIKE
ncbi:DoxX family protein [Leptospira yasudae]|uniref:DoxX family protein n=1 Tax=Leptospira yasudae TaxID=2202201 RepID=A0A6N4QVD5_9LEPT|nr:DoxX family protein [Leptospira yasudae]MBW0435647.1 DoxX family protein [Leptospira yasudae]TGL76765.1 DoxX family protein [Leptospira yasudae]TGL82052.1 DoxX family protein [Leptospira yasudae]TGL84198.1 DoxX family protein [Leptospira yasudae]